MIVNVDALNRRMEYPQFREGFNVWKIALDDAMRFNKTQVESLKTYPLREGEHYIGYIMVDHGEGFVEVCFLDGALVKVKNVKDLINPNSPMKPDMEQLQQEVASGRYYKAVGKKSVCQRVIVPGNQDFTPSVKYYQNVGWIDRDLDPEEISKNLRDRMVESAIHEKSIHLSNKERDILTDHFGLDYDKLFRLSVWEDVERNVG